MKRAAAIACACCLWTLPAAAAPSGPAVFAGPPLPDGSLSVWGSVGFPGVTVGYRQGFSSFEFGAEAGFDYTLTELHADLPLLGSVAHAAGWDLSVGGSLGGFADLGATYFDSLNALSAGLRLSGLAISTWQIVDGLQAFGELQVPAEFPLTTEGVIRVGPEIGGGMELGIGGGYTVAGRALLGPLFEHPIAGGQSDQLRLGGDLEVALGKRFF